MPQIKAKTAHKIKQILIKIWTIPIIYLHQIIHQIIQISPKNITQTQSMIKLLVIILLLG